MVLLSNCLLCSINLDGTGHRPVLPSIMVMVLNWLENIWLFSLKILDKKFLSKSAFNWCDHCSEPYLSMEVGVDGGRAGRANQGATYRANKMSSTNRVGGSEAGERKSIHWESDDPFTLYLNIDTPIKLVKLTISTVRVGLGLLSGQCLLLDKTFRMTNTQRCPTRTKNNTEPNGVELHWM